MFDFIFNRKNSVPRPSLYCVWIRAHEGENAPLIRVWIDPSMSMFDSQAWCTSRISRRRGPKRRQRLPMKAIHEV